MNVNPKKPIALYALLMVSAVLFAACSSDMQPAQQALTDVQSAISAAAPDANKYMPAALTALQAREMNLQAYFDRKDYRAVLHDAPALLADAKSLAQAVSVRKAETMKEAAAEWTDLNSSVPKLLQTVKTRVDALSKTKHQAKGVDLGAAQSALADATASWGKASAAYTAGDAETAVNTAKDAKLKLEAAAKAVNLKLETPAAAPAK